ncbi:MAG: hypothetical protein MZV64_43070 [Ignavibacteriales bacterium]|nr:hypothetical protein [Ignavibacteriales bacterium]
MPRQRGGAVCQPVEVVLGLAVHDRPVRRSLRRARPVRAGRRATAPPP